MSVMLSCDLTVQVHVHMEKAICCRVYVYMVCSRWCRWRFFCRRVIVDDCIHLVHLLQNTDLAPQKCWNIYSASKSI